MNLHNLPKITSKSKKRVGRGHGSGKGAHTVGRGQKGQKSRTSIHPAFMGTKVKKSLLQRLPLMRGKGKFKSLKSDTQIITLDQLNTIEKKTTVDINILYAHKLITVPFTPSLRVKVVANGSIDKPLTVQIPTSASAKQQIEAAGGTVESI